MTARTLDSCLTRVTLRDGSTAIIRPLNPGDAQSLSEGLARLSPESRVGRFFYEKPAFTRTELYDYSHPDGAAHLALMLAVVDETGNECDAVAVARCYRDKANPRMGEVALTTIDEWQRLGIGTALICELARLCRSKYICFWRASFMRANHATRKLLDSVATQVTDTEIGAGALEAIYALRQE